MVIAVNCDQGSLIDEASEVFTFVKSDSYLVSTDVLALNVLALRNLLLLRKQFNHESITGCHVPLQYQCICFDPEGFNAPNLHQYISALVQLFQRQNLLPWIHF